MKTKTQKLYPVRVLRLVTTCAAMLTLSLGTIACDASASYEITVNLPVTSQVDLARGERYDVMVIPHYDDPPYNAVGAWHFGTFCLEEGEDKSVTRRWSGLNEWPATHLDIFLATGAPADACADSEETGELIHRDSAVEIAPPFEAGLPHTVLGVRIETSRAGQAIGNFVADVTLLPSQR